MVRDLSPSPRAVTVVATVPHHLISLVGHMGTYGGQPLQGIKDLFVSSILRSLDDLGFFRDVGHPLLGKAGPDDVSGEVFHRLIVTGLNPGAAVEVEPGMPP